MDETILKMLEVIVWIAENWKPLAAGLVAVAGVVAWRVLK